MMRVLLLLVLAVSCAVCTSTCKHPQPMDDFSLKKFSGKWITVAYDAQDPKDIEAYRNASCAVKHYYMDNEDKKLNKWDSTIFYGKNKVSFDGKYDVTDSKKGFFKTFFKQRNFTYDETVLCTDYTTYCATYMCAEVTPDYTSEFLLLFVRDISKFDEIIHNPTVHGCFKDVLTKSLKEFTKPSIDNCPNL